MKDISTTSDSFSKSRNKMFDVGNTAKHGMLIIAKDEQQAKEIALKKGHIKKIENAKVRELGEKYINDVHFAGVNLKSLLKSGEVGAAVALLEQNRKEWRIY